MPIVAVELKTARERRGWTQEQLAEASGVDKGTISRLEAAVITDPLTSTVDKLETALRTLGRGRLRQYERLAFGVHAEAS